MVSQRGMVNALALVFIKGTWLQLTLIVRVILLSSTLCPLPLCCQQLGSVEMMFLLHSCGFLNLQAVTASAQTSLASSVRGNGGIRKVSKVPLAYH